MNTKNILAIGAGPSGLSLSALATTRSEISVTLLEARPNFEWHSGMMLRNARMQSSALKDLVTPVDPSSPFGFLSFLKSKGRLYSALVNGLGSVSRKEFEQYLHWVAMQQPDLRFDEFVREVTANEEGLTVWTRSGSCATKFLAVSVGKKPFYPPFAKRLLGPQVIHSADFAHNPGVYTGKRVAVIGGGQSGAEIVLEMLGDSVGKPEHVCWISRRANLFMLEDSPFVNEWFHPDFHNWFCDLNPDRRQQLLQKQRMASDGISQSTLEEIYDCLYQTRIDGVKRLALLLSSTVIDIQKTTQGNYQLKVHTLDSGVHGILNVDVIILATGYRTTVPDFLEPIREKLNFVKTDVDEEIVVDNDFGTAVRGLNDCRLFVQNGTRFQHGIANPNLALTAMRSATILNSASGQKLYDYGCERGSIDWQNRELVVQTKECNPKTTLNQMIGTEQLLE